MGQHLNISKTYYEPGPRQLQDWLTDKSVKEVFKKDILCIKSCKTNLNLPVLQKAVASLVQRHESLRSYFPLVNGKIVMKMHNADNKLFSVDYYNLSKQQDIIKEEKAIYLNNIESVCRLQKGPLFKIYVCQTSETLFEINCVIHHIIADAWSLSVIKKELNLFYESGLNNTPVNLPSLSYQLKDYCNEKIKSHSCITGNRHVEFWNIKLAAFDVQRGTQIWGHILKNTNNHAKASGSGDFDRIFKVVTESKSKCFASIIGSDLLNTLKQVSVMKEVSVRNLLYTAFYIAFNNTFKISPVLLASPIADRWNAKYRNIIGNLTGGIYLAREINGYENLERLITDINFDVFKSCRHLIFNHALFQLDEPVLRINCNMFINFDPGTDSKKLKLPLAIKDHSPHHSSYYPLSCSVAEYSDGILCSWCYNESLYSAGAADNIANNFNITLENICKALKHHSITT